MTAMTRSVDGYTVDDRHRTGVRFCLPWALGEVSAAATVAVASTVAAAMAWWITGAAVAVPLALVAAVALATAVEDIASGRIPNTAVLTGLVIVSGSWGFVSTVDNRPMLPLLGDMAAGMLLSGAPAVFLVWLVAPRMMGGGDWKLLSVLGLASGMLAPTAAPVIPMVAFAAGLVGAVVSRRRHICLGPYLALGYVAAIVAAVVVPGPLGSWSP